MIKHIGYFFILLGWLSQPALGQETVYLEADGQIGGGILRSRGSECFVITPGHVIENMLNEASITGTKSVKSKAVLERKFSNDLALLRVTGGGTQNCSEWKSHRLLDEIIEKSFEGILEIKGSNGSNKLIKVLITEKEDTKFVVRPYFQDETIIKGYSGSTLFTLHEGERIILGMLMEVDAYGRGVVLNQKTINNNLDSFFNTKKMPSSSTPETYSAKYTIPETPDNVVESLGFSFKHLESAKRGNKIVMKFTITSMNKDNSLYIYAGNSSYTSPIYDQKGNRYVTSQVKLGSMVSQGGIGNNYTFVRGVPVSLELTVDQFFEDDKSISLDLLVESSGNTKTVAFKNIGFN
jgi:peptidase E